MERMNMCGFVKLNRPHNRYSKADVWREMQEGPTFAHAKGNLIKICAHIVEWRWNLYMYTYRRYVIMTSTNIFGSRKRKRERERARSFCGCWRMEANCASPFADHIKNNHNAINILKIYNRYWAGAALCVVYMAAAAATAAATTTTTAAAKWKKRRKKTLEVVANFVILYMPRLLCVVVV